MRKISPLQILVFNLLLLLCVCLTWITHRLAAPLWAITGDYRPLLDVLVFAMLFFWAAVGVHRLFMTLFPLREGDIPPGSDQEFIYHVYILFYLLVFYPVLRSGIPPAPFMRLLYQALGAKLGSNTYSQGLIHDPLFVQIGDNSTVGQSALIIPHRIEGNELAHQPIRIGDHVTVGANAVILPGVIIGNHATVATGAVVPKGTEIKDYEIWGGVPAKKIASASQRHSRVENA